MSVASRAHWAGVAAISRAIELELIRAVHTEDVAAYVSTKVSIGARRRLPAGGDHCAVLDFLATLQRVAAQLELHGGQWAGRDCMGSLPVRCRDATRPDTVWRGSL